MPYSIPSSTKIRALIIAPVLSILIGALFAYEFVMVTGVYILLCPQEEKVHSFPYTFSCRFIKKI